VLSNKHQSSQNFVNFHSSLDPLEFHEPLWTHSTRHQATSCTTKSWLICFAWRPRSKAIGYWH